jgi:lysophospholipid acyltransferase (LPLAT)-like uncharacterized protein
MSDTPGWQQSASKRRQVALIVGVATPLVATLGRTWRFTSEGAEAYEQVLAAGERPIMAFWHGRILPGIAFWRDRGIVVMTSENFDGEWISRVIERFGFSVVRGSSSRGGAKALVQMKRLMQQGNPTAFTIDGPRGPAERAQPGAVWLAKATGQPILPFHMESTSAARRRRGRASVSRRRRRRRCGAGTAPARPRGRTAAVEAAVGRAPGAVTAVTSLQHAPQVVQTRSRRRPSGHVPAC